MRVRVPLSYPSQQPILRAMKRVTSLLAILLGMAAILPAQTLLESPSAFQAEVDLQMSLRRLIDLVESGADLDAVAERVLLIDGIASSIVIFSEDPADFYIELELVGGTWQGLERVSMHRAYVVIDDPVFAGRLAERAPREPDPDLIVRSQHVLVAGQLVTLAEGPAGELVPVLRALDIRSLE